MATKKKVETPLVASTATPAPTMQVETVEETIAPPPETVPAPHPEPTPITLPPLDLPLNVTPTIEPQPATPRAAPSPTLMTTKNPRDNRLLLIVGIIVIVLALTGAGIWMYKQPKSATPTPLPSPSAPSLTMVSPSPKALALERPDITLEILNGTSTSGLASSTGKRFKELGYIVAKTGNAEGDATQNMLYIDPGLEEKLTVLLADALRELKISTISGYLKDSTISARIILGAE